MVVEELMEGLDDTARRIVVARFFEGRAQHEIAAELGVSQSYLSRLLRGVLRELRSRSGAD
jgi:RNA polymerase sigma factor (sigma-70 family)